MKCIKKSVENCYISFIHSLIWFIIVSPFYPVPNQTNSTLLLLLIYGASNKNYQNLNNGDNVCNIAHNYYWIYLGFLLIIPLIVIINLFIAIFAEIIKLRNNELLKLHLTLKNTIIPVILAIIAAIFYIIIAFGKIYSSNNTLNSISGYNLTLKQAGILGMSVSLTHLFGLHSIIH